MQAHPALQPLPPSARASATPPFSGRFTNGHARSDTTDEARGSRRPRIEMSPRAAVSRRALEWNGMIAEIVETAGQGREEFRFQAPFHLLVVCDDAAHRAGEVRVEGLQSAPMRNVTGKISFVPAGRAYHQWQEPRAAARTVFVYLDPGDLDADTPRLLFEDAMLLATARSLRSVIEAAALQNHQYLDALYTVFLHELRRLADEPVAPRTYRGGLAAWQERVAAAHIEEHLAEPISLAELAQRVRLSTFHFCRAFKQSFGMPPHRYHVARRIEHAKSLLLQPGMTVTEAGLSLGFSETSGFTATFRRLTGMTPTTFVRSSATAPDGEEGLAASRSNPQQCRPSLSEINGA